MPVIHIAAAQCPSIAGDIERNIQLHLQMVEAAVEQGIELLVFPELSLTGYEPAFAERCKLQPTDGRLAPFRQLANRHQITLVLGAPIDTGESRPALGSIVFSPYGVSTYYKQHLHPGEEQFFQPGQASRPIKVKDLPVALAICADSSHPEHVQAAVDAHAHIYASSMMVSIEGFNNDSQQLQQYASQHQITVLMANHCAPTGGWKPAGRSTIWSPEGNVLCSADITEPALVIARQRALEWQGSVRTVILRSPDN